MGRRLVWLAGVSEHLRLPVRIGPDGTFRTDAEDSVEEIRQNVLVILRTRLGERMATPGFGTSDPTFTGFDAAVALDLVAVIEPRADLSVVLQALSALGREQVDLAVRRREST